MKKEDLKKITKKIPKDETIAELSDLFKVFGDATRAKILILLSIENMNVSEISNALNMTISAVSHQLRVLRGSKLIKGIKKGKEVYYSLDDNHVMLIMECGLSHIKE